MKTLLLTLTLVAGLLLPGFADDALKPAELAIQNKDYAKAVELLDAQLNRAKVGPDDYITYLKALALFHDKKDGAAV